MCEILSEEIYYNPDIDTLETGTLGTLYNGRYRGLEVIVERPISQLYDVETDPHKWRTPHPNIIHVIGACTEPGRLQIVTERYATNIEKLLAGREYEFHQVMRFARDVAKGMAWLRDQHYTILPYLKPAHILVDFHDQIKISEFNHKNLADEDHSFIWMAPEYILANQYNDKFNKNDKFDYNKNYNQVNKLAIYSFGIILWQMVTQKIPHQHLYNIKEFIEAVCVKHERPSLKEDKMPLALQNLIQKCWSPNPNDRYNNYSEIVFRLNEIIIDVVIEDTEAALMWKRKFLINSNQELLEEVRWTEFQDMIAEEVKLPAEQIAKLSFLIAQNEMKPEEIEQYVTMEHFNQLIQWFGPFYTPVHGKEILEQMISLVDQPWFHGCITRDQANSCLSNRSQQTFLVRLNAAEPKEFPFIASFPNDEHTKIERVADGLKDPNGAIFRNIIDYVTSFNLLSYTPKIDPAKRAWARYIRETESWKKHQELSKLTEFKDEICLQINNMRDILMAESERITVLARLCRETSTITDLKFPEKHYKYLRSEWLCASLHQVVNEGCTAYTPVAKLKTHIEKIQSNASRIINEIVSGHLYCIYLKDFSVAINKEISQAIALTTKIEKEFVGFTKLMQELSEAILEDTNEPVGMALITGLEATDKVTQLWQRIIEWLNILKEANETILAGYESSVFDRDIRLALPMIKSYAHVIFISLYLRTSHDCLDACSVVLDEMLANTDIAVQNKKENEICEKCSQWQLAVESMVECSVLEILKAF